MRRKWIALVCAILLLPIFTGAYPAPSHEFYVADYANVLSEATQRYMVEQSQALQERTGAQIVAATVESLEGEEIREYGIALAREWEIGSEKNDGILILLATQDRAVTVEVGYGLEGLINDAKAGRMIDQYAADAFSDGDYDGGMKALYTAIFDEVNQNYDGTPIPEESDYSAIFEAVVAVALLILILFLSRKRRRFVGPFTGGRRNFRGGFYGGGFGSGTGGFGGGFGGGASGGGGSFGGGGASRNF